MYSLSSRALQLLQENEAEPEDDVAEPRRKRGRGGAASQQPKPATWTWVMTQLMDLMRQYPGGLAEAAILTELLQRRLRKQGKPDCAAARSDPSPAALPAATAGAASAGAATAGATAAATAGDAVLATAGANHAAGCGEVAALPRRMSLQALLKVNNKRGGAAEAQQQHLQYGGAAAAGAAAVSPTLVVRVSDVECVAPPSKKWGTGAPYETQGGSWLLRLQEEEAYQREQQERQQQARGAGGGGGGATATGRGAAGAAATAAMHLHSALRLCVLGSTPLIAAGSRVRIGAVPMRSCPSGPADSQCAARLLPTRALVPELPPALVGPAVAIWAGSSSGGSSSGGSSSGGSSSGGGGSGGGGVAATAGTADAKAWPRFDALQYGGCVNTLEEAVAGALAHVPPGSGKPLQGWLVARVAPAGVGPPRTTEAGVYDGRMRRTILLTPAFPASSPAQPDGSSNGSASAAAAAGSSSNGTPLVLAGDQVALGDLLLPGELLAVYEPVAVVYEAATAATAATAGCGGSSGAATAAGGAGSPPGCGGGDGGTGRRWVEFTATADTLVTVLPPPPPAPAPSTSSLPPAGASGAAVAGAVAGAALGEPGPAAMDVDAGPLAVAGRTAVAPDPLQIGGRDQAEAVAAVLPAAVAAAALPAHAAAGIAGLLLSGGGARPAAALQHRHQHQLQLQPPPPQQQQQQQQLLLLQPQQRTALVARVEAILGFASGSAKQTGGLLRLLLSDGSGGRAEAALHLARGSKLLSRVWPGHCLVLLGATLAPPPPPPPAQQKQQQQQHQQQHHPNQPPQRLQLRWAEDEAGAELHSLTAMPAATTTPGLVRYTSLEALRRAAVAATAAAAEPEVAEPAVTAEPAAAPVAAGPPRGVWPAAQLRALAAAAAQLPDPRASWRRQVPYLNLPYGTGCMGTASAAAMPTADLGVAAGRPATAAAAAAATADVPREGGVAAAAAAGGGLLMAAHDGGCCSLAAVAGIRSVRVATQRVHRACGRPASRVDLDFGFMDLDEEEEVAAVAAATGGAGAASGGGGGGASCGPAAAAPGAPAAQDTPSRDQRMDGLWHCALCGRDISAPEMEWAFAPGRLELLQPGEEEQQGQERGQQQGQQGQEREQQQGQGQGQQQQRQEAAAPAAVEVVADPGALQGLLGLGAAAFHVLNTAGRQKAIERALRDALSRQPRRFVLSFYPVPPAAAAAAADATATTAAGTATAGHPIWQLQGGHPAGGAPPAVAAAAPLDFWAVAQIRGVDFA